MADAIKVLVSDKLAQEGVDILEKTPGVEVTVKTGMEPDELKRELAKHDAVIIRSATKLTADVLSAAPNLKAIARAGVGVDNVDIPTATKIGAIVMNTPAGNTTSTAELAMSLLLGLCRHIAPASAKLKAGEWDKKSFKGVELAGKTIAVVGLGRIGCAVAQRCRAFEMRVVGYDPFMSADRAKSLGIELFESVPEMVKEADFITVHTPLNDDTRGIIGKAEFAVAKKGVRVVNDARGGIIDEEALLEALENGTCAGAAVDVYTQEPPEDRRLVEHPAVLCTPHLGASTEEAQVNVAVDAAEQIIDALMKGEVRNALNFPALSGEESAALAPFARLAEKLGSLGAQLASGQIEAVEIEYAGELAGRDLRGVTMQCVAGLLRDVEDGVNPVSAAAVARDRGIDVRVVKSEKSYDFQSLVTVAVEAGGTRREIAGAVFGKDTPRLVSVDGYHVEVAPEGTLLILQNDDKAGLIGAIGTVLGDAGVNIAAMSFGRKEAGGDAISVLNIDADVMPDALLTAVEAVDHVRRVEVARV